jgi:hypothetical protein
MTAVYFTEMVARASHPIAKEVVESLLEDEVDHSRAGWAYLASRAAAKSLEGLAAALPSMLERTVGRALSDSGHADAPDDPSMEAFGYLGQTSGTFALRRAFGDVILPGFQRLGVDIRTALAWADARGCAPNA